MILTAEDIGVGQTVINFLLSFVIISFLFGLIFIVRIIWFVVYPASTANIFAGKVLRKVAKYGQKFVGFAFMIILQSFNGLALYTILANIIVFNQDVSLFAIVYVPTLVLSFIAMFPKTYDIIFRYQDDMRRRDWITLICFYSPWAVFEVFSIFYPAGIVF